MIKGIIAKINASPGKICLATLLADVFLFGLGYGGSVGKETLAILATITASIYLVAVIRFIARFKQAIDDLSTFDSILEAIAVIGILFIGFFNALMVYTLWDWIIRTDL